MNVAVFSYFPWEAFTLRWSQMLGRGIHGEQEQMPELKHISLCLLPCSSGIGWGSVLVHNQLKGCPLCGISSQLLALSSAPGTLTICKISQDCLISVPSFPCLLTSALLWQSNFFKEEPIAAYVRGTWASSSTMVSGFELQDHTSSLNSHWHTASLLSQCQHCTVTPTLRWMLRNGALQHLECLWWAQSEVLGLHPSIPGRRVWKSKSPCSWLQNCVLCSWVRYPTKISKTKLLCASGLGITHLLTCSSSAHVLMMVFMINDILLSKIQKITRITPEGSCWRLCTQDYIAVHEAFFLFCKLMQRWNFMSVCWHSRTADRFLNGLCRDDWNSSLSSSLCPLAL